MEMNIWSPPPPQPLPAQEPESDVRGPSRTSLGETEKQGQRPTFSIKLHPRLNAAVIPGCVLVDPGAHACSKLPCILLSYGSSAEPQGPAPDSPGRRAEKEGPQRSRKREKGRNSRNKPLGENQTNRVRAGRSRVWGPGVGGAGSRWEEHCRGLDCGGPDGKGAASLHETPFPRTPDSFKSPAQGAELCSWLRPRPDPQDSAGYPKGGCVGEVGTLRWRTRTGVRGRANSQ